MTRQLIIKLHLILAAFMAPAFILVAISGGLYLMGQKGKISSEAVSVPAGTLIDFKSDTLEADVKAFLTAQGENAKFQYIKNRGNVIQTRPTSRTYYQFENKNGVMTAARKKPNFVAAAMELHKGHGPVAFKWYQKFVALALFFVVLSGFWLGLASKVLRKQSLIVSAAGLVVFLALVFI